MKLHNLVYKSLMQHLFSTLTAIISLALGVALMVAVIGLRNETHRQFTRVGLGIDAVLGPKGSPLQIVLNSIYHLEEMPGKVSWALVTELASNQIVERVIPFCTGHSYAGVRVNAISSDFFNNFEVQPGKPLTFAPEAGGQGRPFKGDAEKEAVIGWEAARNLGIKIGDTFNPTCGVNLDDPVHRDDKFVFVGILAKTGTPHDRAIYIPLESFFGLGGHGADTAKMASDLSSREVSGAYLKIRRIRDGIMHPGIQDLKFVLKQNPEAQLIIPNEVLPALFKIIGWVDHVLIGIAMMVVALGSMFLFVSMLNAMRERRRDYALLRCLGARRRVVFGLVLSESALISILGGTLGIISGHLLIQAGAVLIKAESGVDLQAVGFGTNDLLVLTAITCMGLLTGLIPAIQAYRINVFEYLKPVSI